ncbi:TAXI family TRAP transporter solute-binding subunit [Phaeobacter sp. B1627]|uniref:TAXI family TRAP transporter solute-binding subunit n=1 Tax=Phaeobacter sp. B1627 TaxID=2583809 RepID=UPI001119A793|nr:TAXI family TRAP transporter solute-binding subunit [Phaeobacter sp. B1627]TNJ46845.1 TAXI family TRAP transporter solute-binding subunit [Phaeobacter sp. B1627]
MRARIRALSLCVAASVTFGGLTSSPAQAEDFITIGTGSVSGLYFPLGTAMCRLVNKDRRRHGIRCTADETSGSLDNLQALRDGRLDFAIVQSDWQARAYEGTPQLSNGVPFTDLRALVSLHSEVFTVVARADADIASFSDLRGKRVNIGNPGSGQRATMEVLMAALRWGTDSFSEVHELPAEAQSAALCAGAFDAMVFAVGHPSASVEEATTACDSVLVPLDDLQIRATVVDSDVYEFAEIPGNLYRGNPDPVKSFGFAATLVTTRQQSLRVVNSLVRSIISNLDSLKRAHPAFASLDAAEMVGSYQTAPLHRAARAYFRSEGLLERASP